MVDAQRWTKFVHGSCPWSLMFFFSPPPLFSAWILTLYSPSQLILIFHPSIRQTPTRVLVPSAASPYFLLVATIEATLPRSLFSSMRLGRLLAHSMQRWRLLLKPIPHCIPVRVPFFSFFLLGALWRLPLMTCRFFLLGLRMPRTWSSSTAFLDYLVF